MQHNHIVRAVSFNPGPTPTIIATGGFEKKLRLYDISGATSVAQGSPLANDPPFIEIGAGIHQGTIKSVVWTPDPNVLVTAADDKKLRWFDIRTQDPIASHALDALPSSCELSINPSPGDGGGDTAVLSVAAGKSAYFFSGNRPGELIKSLTLPLELGSVAINTNESKFVTGSSTDTWVRLHDFEDGKELNVHKGHHGPVWSTSFSPDGKLYATGSEDGTVKLWKFTNGPYGLWK